MSTDQLKLWESEFGNEYTDRNVVNWQTRLPAWQVMIGDLQLNHVIEVGSNRGHNLQAIAEIGCAQGNIIGIEPNPNAITLARKSSTKISVLQGDVFSLPFVDDYADLVITSGVLIHIALSDLPKAMAEIYRVSKRHILCAEYYAETDTVIPYHGYENLLWKRNFNQLYIDQHPSLRVIKDGYWEKEYGFDRVTWWLFEK